MTTPIPITFVSLLRPAAAATPISSSLSSPSLPSSVYASRTGIVSAKQTKAMMKSSIPSCCSRSTTSFAVSASCSLGNIVPYHLNIPRRRRRMTYCEFAVKSDSSTATTTSSEEAKIGARIRVKVPLKVYHVPRVREVDLTGMEGELKQYVGLWKGKSISANMPYKVEFVTEIQGRGPVKFFAHLKEDEFEYL